MSSESYYDPENEAAKKDAEEIDQVIAGLRKKWECVQILVSRQTTPEDVSIGLDFHNTLSMVRGEGNWYARMGLVRTWLLQQEEKERRAANADSEDDEP